MQWPGRTSIRIKAGQRNYVIEELHDTLGASLSVVVMVVGNMDGMAWVALPAVRGEQMSLFFLSWRFEVGGGLVSGG